MSEFPHGWSTRVIEEICDIHDYRRIPLSSEERRERKGPYPYYGANNIQDSIDDFIFDFDAVLIAEDGGYYDEHEYRDIAQYATGKYWVNNHAHILTGKPGLDTRFLYYALVRKNICPWINTGTRSKLNQSDLKQIELLVPPLPEQKKIAEILSGIDTLTRDLKNCLAKQEILKKSVVSKLIFNREEDYKRIGETDRYSCLADVSTRITDGTHQAVKTSKSGTIPFLYVSCIKDGKIDWSKSAFISEEQYAIATQGRQPSSGDILYTVVGSYGNAVMVSTSNRFCFQRHIALIQLDQKQVEPKFIEITLSSEEVKKSVDQIVAGNAQLTLTLGELRKLQIPLPSLDKQRRICEIISPLELKISAFEKKIKAMKSLKTAMSADLLSGRKRVSI